MAAYIVAYDLHEEGQNYECLIEKLEAYPIHWHMQQSVWIIKTDQNASQIRNNLGECLDDDDTLFVGKLSGQAAWRGYSDKAGKWLKDIL